MKLREWVLWVPGKRAAYVSRAPQITHHCCPHLRQPGLLHILPVTLSSILYNSAHVLFLHWVLIPPFLCLKTTLNSILSSEGSTNSKARCTRPPSHLLSQPAFPYHLVLCNQWPLPSTAPAVYCFICPANANQPYQSPSPAFNVHLHFSRLCTFKPFPLPGIAFPIPSA